jgi:hypothetical protein
MPLFLLIMPILALMSLLTVVGGSCSSNVIQSSTISDGITTLSAYSGANPVVSRSVSSGLLVTRLIKANGKQLTPVANSTITFSSNDPTILFVYKTVQTDTFGVARNYLSTGPKLGTFAVTAVSSEGAFAVFNIEVRDLSPTSATITTTDNLEYSSNASDIASVRTNQVITTGASYAVNYFTSALTTYSNQPMLASTALPSSDAVVNLFNIAEGSQTVSLSVASSYPPLIQSGTCKAAAINPSSLLYQPCTVQANGMTFARSKLTYNTNVGVTIYSNGASTLDSKNSNLLPIKNNVVKIISKTNTASDDIGSNFTPFSNTVLYTQSYGGRIKLFKHVGRTMFQLSNINTTGSDSPANLTVSGSRVYFSAFNGTGTHLYYYDGTSINQISNLNVSGDDKISSIAVSGSNVYFSGSRSGSYSKLFRYSVSENRIYQVSDIVAGGTDGISNLYNFNDSIAFVSTVSGASKLFIYNGASITQVSNTFSSGDDFPSNFATINNTLYFSADTASGVSKLFSYTNSDGTKQIADIMVSLLSDNIGWLTNFSGSLYFTANTPGNGTYTKIYKYDGMTITRISNLNPLDSDAVSSLSVYSGGLYFKASLDGSNFHLFRYDGVKIDQVSKIFNTGSDEGITGLYGAYGGLYFSALNNSDSYFRIYRYCNGDSACYF